jgi:hypothetical protein
MGLRTVPRHPGLVLIATFVAGCAVNATPSASFVASSSSPLTSPSAIESSSTSPAPAAWQQVGSFGTAGGWDRATGLAIGNGGLLAIGSRAEPEPEVGTFTSRDYLWASADGKAWEELQLPAALDGARLVTITTTPTGGFILYANRGEASGLAWHPIVLTSADGRGGWTAAGNGLADDLFIGKVVRGEVGYVLLVPQAGDHDPALWFSEDGLTWELTHNFDQTDHWMQVSDVGAGSEGFVAIGIQIEQDNTTWNRLTIASGDGHEWFESAEPFGPQDPGYRPDAFVSALGSNWLAALPALDDSARFWFSADGLDWRPAGRIDGVVVTQSWSPVFFNVGGRVFFSHNGNELPVAFGESPFWESVDGAIWEAPPIDKALGVKAGVSGPGWTVFAGSVQTENGESRAAFWYLPAN